MHAIALVGLLSLFLALHSIQHIKYRLSKLLKKELVENVDSFESSKQLCVCESVCERERTTEWANWLVGRNSKHTTLSDLCPVLLCSISVFPEQYTVNHSPPSVSSQCWNLRFLRTTSPFFLAQKFHRYRFSIKKINFPPSHIILLIEVEILHSCRQLSEILIEWIKCFFFLLFWCKIELFFLVSFARGRRTERSQRSWVLHFRANHKRSWAKHGARNRHIDGNENARLSGNLHRIEGKIVSIKSNENID